MRGAGALQVGAALVGRFETEVENARGQVIHALGLAIMDVAAALVAKLRQDIASSGLENAAALQKTWAVRYYGAGRSLEPAAWIYSRFPVLQAAFESAPVIQAGSGKYLLMPNPDVWPNGRVRRPRARGGANASATLQVAERRFGPLEFIPLKNGRAVLVAKVRASAKAPGVYRKASASALARLAAGRASGLQTVVVFFLVKAARMPRLLRGAILRRRAEATAPGELARAFERRFTNYDPAGPRQLTDGRLVKGVRAAAPGDGGWGDWEMRG